MLILSSWSDQFRADIGFKGVSQLWHDTPAWYFWLTDSAGVFKLELTEAHKTSNGQKGGYAAFLTLKCYPHTDRPEFTSFSFIERNLVKSHLFDDTNTPIFEHHDNIPAGLFSVATIEMSMDSDGDTCSFSYESMDRLRSCHASQHNQVDPLLSLEHRFERQEIDRNVPGFSIGYRLFDCLLCLYAHAHKHPPQSVTFAETPGYEVILDGDRIEVQPSSEIRGLKVCARYHNRDVIPSMINLGDEVPELGIDQQIFFHREYPCGHFHASREEETLPVRLNKRWWSLAHRHYDCTLASTCGCH
jgi:hypothetical protein